MRNDLTVLEGLKKDPRRGLFYYMIVRVADALALPLGELSPQVTERALHPLLNHTIDLCAYTAKIRIDILIGESQNL